MATSSAGLLPFPAKAGGWGESSLLLPNPDIAIITFHTNEEMRLATALLGKKKNAKPWFHRYPFAFHILSFWCIRLGAAENVPVLILLASPIMLLFK